MRREGGERDRERELLIRTCGYAGEQERGGEREGQGPEEETREMGGDPCRRPSPGIENKKNGALASKSHLCDEPLFPHPRALPVGAVTVAWQGRRKAQLQAAVAAHKRKSVIGRSTDSLPLFSFLLEFLPRGACSPGLFPLPFRCLHARNRRGALATLRYHDQKNDREN